MKTYTAFILEDKYWDRSALTNILNSIDNIQIIGFAETIPDAISECEKKKPDLIIVDGQIGYDKRAGEKFVRYIRKQQPEVRFLGLSYHPDLLPGLKQAGCHYAEHKTLIENFEAAKKFIAGALSQQPIKYRDETPPSLNTIQDRVLKLICEGFTEAEIGQDLLKLTYEGFKKEEIDLEIKNASLTSVKRIKQSLFDSFGAKNAPHLVHLAYRTGYLDPNSDQ